MSNTAPPKGSFTIKTAGVFFILSAILELTTIQSAVPLFGAIREGSVAWTYHLINTTLFLLAGLGLLEGSLRGLAAFYIMTAVYIIEQLLYLFDNKAIEAQLHDLSEISTILGILDTNTLVETVKLTSASIILGTLFFALYIYYRREYFSN